MKPLVHAFVTLCIAAAVARLPVSDRAEASSARHTTPNIVVIIADDLGIDRVGAYGVSPDAPPTPNIDRLAREGILFRHAWSMPSCSPTRASMLTGRFPFRLGVGGAINYSAVGTGLSTTEVILPELLEKHTSIALGKWHLTTASDGGPAHTIASGFDQHAGTVAQVNTLEDGDYYQWQKVVDGRVFPWRAYATTDTSNDAISVIRDGTDDPWFMWLAFNAPHAPLHIPPQELHSYGFPDDDLGMGLAMIEALDTEVGRVLDAIDASEEPTVVFFVGDNGTTSTLTTPPFDPDHAKPTTYEGGVHVPLIVRGPGVTPGAECGALVSLVDIFATVLQIAGSRPPPGVTTDSISIVPYLRDPSLRSLRPWLFTEKFTANTNQPVTWRRAVRDTRYKLHRAKKLSGAIVEEFYDLTVDPFEQHDLLSVGGAPLTPNQAASYETLNSVIDDLHAESGF